MKDFLESGTAWITAHVQSLGADFDPEILSWPGGSLIAALLWFYARITAAATRAQGRRLAAPLRNCAAGTRQECRVSGPR
jgi:hypothetical protein